MIYFWIWIHENKDKNLLVVSAERFERTQIDCSINTFLFRWCLRKSMSKDEW